MNGSWDMIADQSDLGFWNTVQKLQTDPDDADVLYAATSDGLFRTMNANNVDPTWTKIVLPEPTDPPYGAYSYAPWQFVFDLEIEPGNGQHVYVAVRFRGEDPGTAGHFVHYWKLLHSMDGGTTWGEIPNTPIFPWVTGPTDSNAELLTIEVSHAAPNALYVLFDVLPAPGFTGNANDRIYRVTNASTGQWDPPLVSGFYNWYGAGHGFSVSQTDADVLAVANEDRYLVYDHGTIIDWNADESNKNQYHVDVEDLAFDPITGDLWMADHGAVHLSTDMGTTWEFVGRGLGVAQCYGTAPSYSEPGYIAIGLNHDGNVLSDGNFQPGWQPDWRQLDGLDGQHPMVDPKQSRYVYSHSQHNLEFHRSDDHGVTQVLLSPGTTEWNTHNVMDREMPEIFYVVVGGTKIKRTMDRGDSFSVVADFGPFLSGPGCDLGAIIWRLYSSFRDPEVIFAHVLCRHGAVADEQFVFRCENGRGPTSQVLSSWELIETPINGDIWLSDLEADLELPGVVYYGASSSLTNGTSPVGSEMLFRVDYNLPASDPGRVIDLTGSGANALPNVGGGMFALERGSNGGVYFGTDMGVFYTNNAFRADGTGWVLFGDALPHIGINDLEINYEANKIRTALVARGVWEHDLYCPALPDAAESGTYSGPLFLEVKNEITSTAIVPLGIQVDYRAGSEVALQPGFHTQAGSSFHAFIHGCDAPGNSFKSAVFNDHSGEGMWDKRHFASYIQVFPNPVVDGSFSLALTEPGACSAEVDVVDVMGRAVSFNWRFEGCHRAGVTLMSGTTAALLLVRVIADDSSIRSCPLSIMR
ncbi:MAG: hypothetical protein JNM31_04855 [Flavobacteriales bacterium]|nr:hypothetical protein [Flavobacteriales bacterium]